MSWSLKLVLELPGVFDMLPKHMTELENEIYIKNNMMQALLWIDKYENLNNQMSKIRKKLDYSQK